MNELEIKPGDLVELKLICQVDEVKFTVNGGYFLKASYTEGPLKCNPVEIDMNKANKYVRKLKFDPFLGVMK